MTNELPVGSPTSRDLGLFLGADVDTERAEVIITAITNLAQSFVDPIPPAGQAIVLGACARAYASVQGASSETIGPYSVSRPPSGVYFTKAERSELRRLAGQGGAYTIDTAPDAVVPPTVVVDVDGFPLVTDALESDDLDPEDRPEVITVPEWWR